MKKLAIIGAGDLGDLISYHATQDGHYHVVGFYDDYAAKGSVLNNIEVLGKIAELEEHFSKGIFDVLMIGVGYNHMSFRKTLFEKYDHKIPFGNIIHSSAFVDPSVKLGTGVFILPGCTLDKSVVIGNNVLLNTSVCIAHDTTIGDHCFLSPRVSIAGKTHIKHSCVLGINSTIIDNINIEPEIKIAAGTVVIKSLTQKGLYAGVPAIFKKEL
ncbi:MAG: acetyltransferase [Bacteroidota bacterium]